MKSCAFQYATDDRLILEDTDLITKDEALALWEKYLPTFKEHLEAGRGPEMALWVDMKNNADYHTAERHYCGDDFIMKGSEMYQLVPVI